MKSLHSNLRGIALLVTQGPMQFCLLKIDPAIHPAPCSVGWKSPGRIHGGACWQHEYEPHRRRHGPLGARFASNQQEPRASIGHGEINEITIHVDRFHCDVHKVTEPLVEDLKAQ
jgi:hypothetical protein